jgi:hypothetical protein
LGAPLALDHGFRLVEGKDTRSKKRNDDEERSCRLLAYSLVTHTHTHTHVPQFQIARQSRGRPERIDTDWKIPHQWVCETDLLPLGPRKAGSESWRACPCLCPWDWPVLVESTDPLLLVLVVLVEMIHHVVAVVVGKHEVMFSELCYSWYRERIPPPRELP